VNEPPSDLSIFSEIDYKRRGNNVKNLEKVELQKMRHYIITNCDEARKWVEEHKTQLTRDSSINIKKRHKEHFVRWFEIEIAKLYEKGEASKLMHALPQGPDPRARVLNRVHMNNWLFRTAATEKSLVTQNSGVLVKGDDSTGNMTWYGVIRNIISLEFPQAKEVILFQCDWYDVPATSTSRSRGYILASNAEPVFYVPIVYKPGWSTIVLVRPRNLFSMPDTGNDANALDVGIQEMNESGQGQEFLNWSRQDRAGTTGSAAIINQVRSEAIPEPVDDYIGDDDSDDDDTYIDEGVIAPVMEENIEDDLFV